MIDIVYGLQRLVVQATANKKAFDIMVKANQEYWTSQSTFYECACGVISATNSNLQVVNIANSSSCTLNEVIEHLLSIFKKKLLIKNDLSKASMIPVRKISINLAKKKLKFKNRYSLKEGLKNTVEWYKSNKHYL